METKHTPGPWQWWDRFGREAGTGKTHPGKNMLGEDSPIGQCSHNSFVVSDSSSFIVARCSNALVTMDSERSEANARLIAAASTAPHDCTDPNCPGAINKRKLEAFDEMLEALRHVDEICLIGYPARQMVRAAIAKAMKG